MQRYWDLVRLWLLQRQPVLVRKLLPPAGFSSPIHCKDTCFEILKRTTITYITRTVDLTSFTSTTDGSTFSPGHLRIKMFFSSASKTFQPPALLISGERVGWMPRNVPPTLQLGYGGIWLQSHIINFEDEGVNILSIEYYVCATCLVTGILGYDDRNHDS